MSKLGSRGLTIVASIALLMTVRFSAAADKDDNSPPADADAKSSSAKFSGKVEQFNYTPRGERDGILITSDGKLVQLSFAPHEASKIAEAVAIGDEIKAEGTPEQTKADHAVCHLQKLTTAKGKDIELEGPPQPRDRDGELSPDGGPRRGQRGPRAERGERGERGPRAERAAEKTETLKGVVKSLNHGARGEVDGAVLENGDFVHLGGREAEEAKLAVGQDISVEGQSLKMPDGHTMIEHPTKINDKEVSRRPRGRGPAAGDGPAPPPKDRPAPPPGDAPDEK